MGNWDNMVDIKNNSFTSLFVVFITTILTGIIVSLEYAFSEISILSSISYPTFVTFPISMLLAFGYTFGIIFFAKSFIPSRIAKFCLSPILFKDRVFFKTFINLTPIVVRLMTDLETHFAKCRANLFGKSFIPCGSAYAKSGFIMAMTIFCIMNYPVFVKADTRSEIATTTLTRSLNLFVNNDNHTIHYTIKVEGNQEKSGEFGETPNVKTRTIPSQAIVGIDTMEGVTTNGVSPNNNPLHELPTRKGRYSLSSMDNILKYGLNDHTITKLNSIPFTYKIEALSEFDIKEIVKNGLLDDAVKCVDGEVERQYNATPLRYVGTATAGFVLTTNGTATATNTSVLNSYHVRKMRLELEKRNVPTWDGDYVCIASLEAMEGLEGALETINSYTDTGYKKILNGEVGRLHGVRFVKDAFATRFTYDSTARTATAKSWGTANSLEAYMFGKPTVAEAITIPEEIRMKIATDFGRSKGLAWYGLFGWKIMWSTAADARIIKWDSAG